MNHLQKKMMCVASRKTDVQALIVMRRMLRIKAAGGRISTLLTLSRKNDAMSSLVLIVNYCAFEPSNNIEQ
jgi:hypothetical protein